MGDIENILGMLLSGGNPFGQPQQQSPGISPPIAQPPPMTMAAPPPSLPNNLPVQSIIQSLMSQQSQAPSLQAPDLSAIQSLIRPVSQFNDPVEELRKRIAEQNQQPDPFAPLVAQYQQKLAQTPQDIGKGQKALYSIGAILSGLGGNQGGVAANLGGLRQKQAELEQKRSGYESNLNQVQFAQAQRKAQTIERQNTQLTDAEQMRTRYQMAVAQSDQGFNDQIKTAYITRSLDAQNQFTRQAHEDELARLASQDAFMAGRQKTAGIYFELTGNWKQSQIMANKNSLGQEFTPEENASLDKGWERIQQQKEKQLGGNKSPLNTYNYQQVNANTAAGYLPTPALARELETKGKPSYPTDVEETAYKEGNRTGIDPYLILEVLRQESSFNKKAVSPKGALGIAQFMPDTAKRFGLDAEKMRTDPEYRAATYKEQIRAQADYLKELSVKYNGDEKLMLAAYNSGETNVQKAGNKIPDFPETQNYVKTVYGNVNAIRGMNVTPPEMTDAEKYGFALKKEEADRNFKRLQEDAEYRTKFMTDWRGAGDSAYQSAMTHGVPMRYGEPGAPPPPNNDPALIGQNVPNPMAAIDGKPFIMRTATEFLAQREAIAAQRLKATRDGFNPDSIDALARQNAGPLARQVGQQQAPQGISASVDAALSKLSPEQVAKEIENTDTWSPEQKKQAQDYLAGKTNKQTPLAPSAGSSQPATWRGSTRVEDLFAKQGVKKPKQSNIFSQALENQNNTPPPEPSWLDNLYEIFLPQDEIFSKPAGNRPVLVKNK